MLKQKLQHSNSDVFNACIKALNNIEADVVEQDKSNGIIVAKAGVTFLSWGNTITITLKNKGQLTDIEIESTSNMLQINWGVNEKYEENLLVEIKNILRK